MNDLAVHHEKGYIVENNSRLNNQVVLSHLKPEFIPQLVVPDNQFFEQYRDFDKAYANPEGTTESFPVQKIKGEHLGTIFDLSEKFGMKELIVVLKETIRQLQEIYVDYGILMLDRNLTNIMLEPTEDETGIIIGNQHYRVWQVDLADVYDEVEGKYGLSFREDYESRVGKPKKTKERIIAEHNMDNLTKSILSEIVLIYEEEDSNKRKSKDEERALEYLSRRKKSNDNHFNFDKAKAALSEAEDILEGRKKGFDWRKYLRFNRSR